MPDDVLNGILDSASDDQSANSTGRTPLVIDSDLRTINVPTDYVFGVQNDQDVLTVPFVVPRYCDGVDLSELSIRINFTTKSGLSSYYDVTDKTVNTDTIEFTWLLGAAVFVSVGDLTFAVCIRKVEADGRITREFNTTLATAKILPGLTVEDQKDPTQYSILVQMQNLASSVNSTIEDVEEYAEQLRNYVGAPLVATAASDMTDQNRIYVYVGNENGYNNGHWYYYQSLTWHDGGTYSALPAGDYPDIYAGNVMSDRYQMDSAPYLFRPTGGGLQRIGERCYPVLVGASVAWNQLSNPSDLPPSGTVNGIEMTNNGDGTITANGTATASVAYQLAGTFKAVVGHKYYLRGCPTGGSNSTYSMNTSGGVDVGNGIIKVYNAESQYIWIAIQPGVTVNNITYKPNFFDLTAMFGTTIADYIYSLESATAGAGIAKLKEWGFLTGGYIPYNAGTLESVEATAHKMVGFNQWDEVAEVGTIIPSTGRDTSATNKIRSKNYIPVIPSAVYHLHVGSTSSDTDYVYFYDADKTFVGNNYSSHGASWDWNFTVPDNAYYMRFIVKNTTYNHDICINLSNPDRNGEYEAYVSHTYDLGTDTLRGLFKLDSNNNLYADGDTMTSDGTVTRKYGVVDLGTLNWTFNNNSSWNCFIANAGKKKGTNNLLCDTYPFGVVYGSTTDKIMSGNLNNNNIYIRDSSFNGDATDFKTAMSGVMLVYEAATPTTEQSTPFTSPQICYPDGTEEFVTENNVPVGHVTKYPYDIKTQAERLIDVPDVPSINGTYVLKATRSSSGLTYTWVAG